jgi:putative transposase
MVTLEFRLVGKPRQYAALDEAIRTAQFIRNKCVRLWQDIGGTTLSDLSRYCRILAQEYAFVRKLNSMARQAGAERAWAAITRFYRNCNSQSGRTSVHSVDWSWDGITIPPAQF